MLKPSLLKNQQIFSKVSSFVTVIEFSRCDFDPSIN
jgi:hypothetical protein